MKKMILVGLLLFSMLLVFGGVKTSAVVPPDYFLPNDVNYLNPKNIYYTPIDGDYDGLLKSREDIRVKEDTEYYIYCVYGGSVEIVDANIKIWDYDLDEEVVIEHDLDGSMLYFEIPVGTDRASIEFEAINVNRNPNIYIWNVGANYVMAEAGTFDDEQLEGHSFRGYDTSDYSMLGDSIQINTVASKPISYNTIFNSLYVFDYKDGILTNEKTVVKNTYGTSDYKVGDWEIEFTVKNSRNISKNLVIKVHVDDDIKPVISGPNEIEMENIALLTLDEVKAELTATDNYDGDLTDSIEVDAKNDSFTNRTEQLGTFPVTFKVTDSNGNIGSHVVNLVVNQGDFAAPVFTGTFYRNLSMSSPMTTEELLADIQANDDYSGNVTSKIKIIYDDYKYNTNKPGSYKITLSVTDNAGNTATQDINIDVYDDTAPTFAFASTFVYLPLKANMEDVGDIVTMLQRTGYLTEDEYIIKSDSYSKNKNALGSYVLTLEQNDIQTNIIINVEESIEYLSSIELPKTVEYNINLTDRPAFLNMMYDVCCRVKSFFKDFFSSIF